MKIRLLKLSRWIFLVTILLSFNLKSFCNNDNQPNEEDRKGFYNFWQAADLYILEKINEKFLDNLDEQQKKDLSSKIEELSDDEMTYYRFSNSKTNKYILPPRYTDFLDDFKIKIKDKKLILIDFINESISIKSNIRKKAVWKGAEKLPEELPDFKNEIDSLVAKYQSSNGEHEIKTTQHSASSIGEKVESNGNENNTNTSEINKIKTQLEEVINRIESLKKQIDSKIESQSSKEPDSATPENKTTIYFFAGFLLLGLLALFFLFYMLRKNLNNKIAELQVELSAFRSSISRQFEQKDTEWRKRNTEFQNAVSNKINDTQRDLDDLYRRVQQYESKQGSKPAFNQSYADSVQSKPAPPPPPPPKRTITYYLPGPDPSGYFWNDKKSSTPDGSSIYQLVVEEDNQSVGELSFYKGNEKSIKMALSNPSLYIKPVCQSIDNIYSGSTIEMKSPGRLQLSGDKWIIANGEKMKVSIR